MKPRSVVRHCTYCLMRPAWPVRTWDGLKVVFLQVIQKIHVHDDYNPRDYTHDLALLELSAVALMSKRVGLVCLPTSTECTQKRFSSGTRGIVTGWGRMGEGLFPELQELNMTVIEGEPCRDYFIQQGELLLRCPPLMMRRVGGHRYTNGKIR